MRPSFRTTDSVVRWGWIGAIVTVLGGVTIGEGSIVAAVAPVNRDVPSNTMVAGVLARHVKALE